jgi:hypothetical protein
VFQKRSTPQTVAEARCAYQVPAQAGGSLWTHPAYLRHPGQNSPQPMHCTPLQGCAIETCPLHSTHLKHHHQPTHHGSNGQIYTPPHPHLGNYAQARNFTWQKTIHTYPAAYNYDCYVRTRPGAALSSRRIFLEKVTHRVRDGTLIPRQRLQSSRDMPLESTESQHRFRQATYQEAKLNRQVPSRRTVNQCSFPGRARRQSAISRRNVTEA